MRKVWTGLLALVLVAALCAPLLVSAYADAMVYYVNTANKKSLNMRSSTDLGNNILTSIPNGAAVVVYEFLNSNTWAHIGYGGRDGYVMTRYLSLTPPSTQPSTAESLSFKDFKSTYYLASVKPSTPSGYVNTVSYTHIDVYKRQVSSLAGLVSSKRRLHLPPYFSAVRKSMIKALQWPICMYPVGAGGKRVCTGW